MTNQSDFLKMVIPQFNVYGFDSRGQLSIRI